MGQGRSREVPAGAEHDDKASFGRREGLACGLQVGGPWREPSSLWQGQLSISALTCGHRCRRCVAVSRLMHGPDGAGVGPDRPRRTTAASLRHQSLDDMRVDEEQHLSCARAAHSLERMRSDMPRLHACHCPAAWRSRIFGAAEASRAWHDAGHEIRLGIRISHALVLVFSDLSGNRRAQLIVNGVTHDQAGSPDPFRLRCL